MSVLARLARVRARRGEQDYAEFQASLCARQRPEEPGEQTARARSLHTSTVSLSPAIQVREPTHRARAAALPKMHPKVTRSLHPNHADKLGYTSTLLGIPSPSLRSAPGRLDPLQKLSQVMRASIRLEKLRLGEQLGRERKVGRVDVALLEADPERYWRGLVAAGLSE